MSKQTEKPMCIRIASHTPKKSYLITAEYMDGYQVLGEYRTHAEAKAALPKVRREYLAELKNPKRSRQACTDCGQEFTIMLCEDCGGDTFHVGNFDGEPRFQCVTCHPTTERTVH